MGRRLGRSGAWVVRWARFWEIIWESGCRDDLKGFILAIFCARGRLGGEEEVGLWVVVKSARLLWRERF